MEAGAQPAKPRYRLCGSGSPEAYDLYAQLFFPSVLRAAAREQYGHSSLAAPFWLDDLEHHREAVEQGHQIVELA
jgi:hypothetical protein